MIPVLQRKPISYEKFYALIQKTRDFAYKGDTVVFIGKVLEENEGQSSNEGTETTEKQTNSAATQTEAVDFEDHGLVTVLQQVLSTFKIAVTLFLDQKRKFDRFTQSRAQTSAA